MSKHGSLKRNGKHKIIWCSRECLGKKKKRLSWGKSIACIPDLLVKP